MLGDHALAHERARFGEDERALGRYLLAEHDRVGALDDALELRVAVLDRLLANVLPATWRCA